MSSIHQEYNRIDGCGNMVHVVISGVPSMGCYGCHGVLSGAFVSCLQHFVTREEKKIEDDNEKTD